MRNLAYTQTSSDRLIKSWSESGNATIKSYDGIQSAKVLKGSEAKTLCNAEMASSQQIYALPQAGAKAAEVTIADPSRPAARVDFVIGVVDGVFHDTVRISLEADGKIIPVTLPKTLIDEELRISGTPVTLRLKSNGFVNLPILERRHVDSLLEDDEIRQIESWISEL